MVTIKKQSLEKRKCHFYEMIDTTNTAIYLLYVDGILKKRWYSYHNHCYTEVEISNIHENEN